MEVKKLTDEQEKMILDNLKLIDLVLNDRFSSVFSEVPYEDLWQVGYFGLHEAVLTKTDKGKLNTWAYNKIRWEVLQYLNIYETPAGVKIPRNYMMRYQQEIRKREVEGKKMDQKEREEHYQLSEESLKMFDMTVRRVLSTDETVKNSNRGEEGTMTFLDVSTTENLSNNIPPTEVIAIGNLEREERWKLVYKGLEELKSGHETRYEAIRKWVTEFKSQRKIAEELDRTSELIYTYTKDFSRSLIEQEGGKWVV